MAEQIVTLNPGESKIVTFEAIPYAAKTYSVKVDGLTGSFRAASPPSGIFYGYVRTLGQTNIIPNALIQAYYDAATFTDKNGYYEIAGLLSGRSYKIACYGESHWPAISSTQFLADKAIEVNFNLSPMPLGSPMLPPRKIIYCGANPAIPTVLRGGQWEVISDDGYANNLYEWLQDPSIEYAYLVAEHGSTEMLYLKKREDSETDYDGIVIGVSSIKKALANRQPFKLIFLRGCNTVHIGGTGLSKAFGGSALGQSKDFFGVSGIEFFTNLNAGLSAYQAYIACSSYVTRAEIGLLTYWGDTTPEFRLG